MTVGSATTSYSYDDADRLTAVTPPSPAPAINYTWDDNGELTARGSDGFSWDFEDRMVSATVNSVTTTFAYRGDGCGAAGRRLMCVGRGWRAAEFLVEFCRIHDAEAEADVDLVVADFAIGDGAANFLDLEPVEALQGLAGAANGALDGVFDARC